MTLNRLLEFAQQSPLLSLAFVGLTLAIVYTELSRRLQPFKRIGPARLTALINREDAVVIDLRSAAEFEKGHIAGARHVAANQLGPAHKALASARDMPVALVCGSGTISQSAAAGLAKAGFKRVFLLDGGIGAWQQADLPLVKGRA